MRLAALLVVAACSSPGSETGPRVITIDEDSTALATALGGRVIEHQGDVAVVEIDAEQLEPLSAKMHDQFGRCGGFALHDSLADAEAFLVPAQAKPIKYTIDKPELVTSVVGRLDEQRILGTIRELSSMKTRYYKSKEGADASTWIAERWRSFSDRSDIKIDFVDHGYPQKSVVMTIPGTTKPSEIVVIGGHLDSINMGGGAAPGADDDASGIATLTEVARVLLQSDFRPERTIQFMAYAAEEVGLRGSLSIAKDYAKRKVDVVGAMQLDMTNYQGSGADIWMITDHTNAAQNSFVTDLIERYTGATWGFDKCGYACSDHASWHRYGFAASMPFEARFQDMNHHIHTTRDTLEQSNDNAAHAVKFARLGAAYAIELAKGSAGTADALAQPTDDGGRSWKWWGVGLLALAALGIRRLRRR